MFTEKKSLYRLKLILVGGQFFFSAIEFYCKEYICDDVA